MHVFKQSMIALVLVMLVSACSTSGASVSTGVCVGALRLTQAQIEMLDDAQVRRVLDLNAEQERRGCAIPNR